MIFSLIIYKIVNFVDDIELEMVDEREGFGIMG